MRLPKFEYAEPQDVREALTILQDEPAARILAGGTDLLVNMKHRVERPRLLVNIKRLKDLRGIRKENGELRIGALATLKSIAGNPLIAQKLPALAQAASSVGSYHHQVMGTLAGNVCQQNRCKYFNQSLQWRNARGICFKAGGEICHVVHKKEVCYSTYCGDMAPALMMLEARVVLKSRDDAREIPLEGLYTGDGKFHLGLGGGELLAEIIIPPGAEDGLSAYVKFANRESIDFPIVGVAVWVSEKTKTCRVAFTAVDRKPVRAKDVEAFLKGKDLDGETLGEAAGLAARVGSPSRSSLYSPAYKRKMMGLLLKSAVDKALGRSES